MGDPEGADEACRRIDSEGRQHGEIERAPGHAGDVGDGASGQLEVAHDLTGRTDHRLAGSGEHQSPTDAVEQRGAQLGFEGANRL